MNDESLAEAIAWAYEKTRQSSTEEDCHKLLCEHLEKLLAEQLSRAVASDE